MKEVPTSSKDVSTSVKTQEPQIASSGCNLWLSYIRITNEMNLFIEQSHKTIRQRFINKPTIDISLKSNLD